MEKKQKNIFTSYGQFDVLHFDFHIKRSLLHLLEKCKAVNRVYLLSAVVQPDGLMAAQL